MTNAKSVINAILMDTVSVICNQLYWIYMTNALSVSEYWKEEVCVGKAIRRYREEAGITQERLAELVDISTNHLGAIEREVKTPTMETFVKLLNVLGAEPNEVLKEVIPLTRMEHTSVVEGKLERLTPKKQESVLRMLDVIIEEMMK